jgi:hypothetical protein
VYDGIYTNRLWVQNIGDNSDTDNTNDNIGSPWYGFGADDRANGNNNSRYGGTIPIVSGYNGVAMRSGAGNIFLTLGGNVGMGTTNPSYALHIVNDNPNLSLGKSDISGGFLILGNENHGVGRGLNKGIFTDGNDVNVTTAGTGDCVLSSGYGSNYITMLSDGNAISSDGTPFGLSDMRIKRDIRDIDDLYALEKIREIKPRLYSYKSNEKHNETVFGFIAQEIKETLPYSTYTGTECIPNIQEYASVSMSNVLSFSTFNTNDLESNSNTLRIYTDVENYSNVIETINITEIIDEHSIRVDKDFETPIVFVYGQQIDDFLFLKKEHIFTVATAALQEVDRQLQAEKTKVANLEAQLASVLARLDALENPP